MPANPVQIHSYLKSMTIVDFPYSEMIAPK